MTLEIESHLRSYNETTANWDLIIEPFQLKALASLSSDSFHLSLVSPDGLHIDVPASAVSHCITLANEIKASIYSRDKTFTELPQFWLENDFAEETLVPSTVEKSTFFLFSASI
jgi:hypothetical protein